MTQGYRKVAAVESGMTEIEIPGLLKHFADLPDPRKPRGVRHELRDIVVISILAVICGANSYSQIHQYALAQQDWLKTFLKLPSAIPSQDTFERIFALLKPDAWQARFLEWSRTLVLPNLPEDEEDEVLAMDGKTARASAQRGLAALHTVSVWSSQFEVVLAQQQVPDKTNEITVMPDLLEVVNPAGAVITADAMGCQKQIAWTAREHHAHYLLALKDNHPTLLEDVLSAFDYAQKVAWDLPHSATKTIDHGHGRQEVRQCQVLEAPEWLHEKELWRDLKSIVQVQSTRTINNTTSEQTRYFLTSLPMDAKRALRAARYHWGIENGLHWVLDVAFDEDASRAHLENAQATWVALRHLVISLLKRDKTVKAGVEAKRLRAGWDRNYLLKLLES
jgi:predicted transposase YbfD/YdcC